MKFENKRNPVFDHLLARLRSTYCMPKDGHAFERLVESAKRASARYASFELVTLDCQMESIFRPYNDRSLLCFGSSGD